MRAPRPLALVLDPDPRLVCSVCGPHVPTWISMAFLNYFQPATSMLLKPDGPLSRVIPASSIAAANKEVKKVLGLPT